MQIFSFNGLAPIATKYLHLNITRFKNFIDLLFSHNCLNFVASFPIR